MPSCADAGAQVRLVAAPRRAHGVARAARGIDVDVLGQVIRALRREAEPGEDVRHVRLRTRRPSGSCLRVIASSCASVYAPRGRKPLYQMSNGSSGRPRRFSISAATRGTSGEREHLLEHRPHARLGHLAVFVEAARDVASAPSGEYGIGQARGAEVGEQLRVARVGLRRRFGAARAAGRARRSRVLHRGRRAPRS